MNMDEHVPHLNHLICHNIIMQYHSYIGWCTHWAWEKAAKCKTCNVSGLGDTRIPPWYAELTDECLWFIILSMKRCTTYPTFSLRLFAQGNQVRQSPVHGSDFALNMLRVEQKEMSKSRPINSWNSRLGTVGRWPLQRLQEGRKVDQLQRHPGESWRSTHAKAISEFRGQGA